jgi:hypothetical protein
VPKIKQSVETEVIDAQGNITSKRANRVLNWGAEPPFVKVYLQDVLYLSDLPKGHENILFELLRRGTYAGDQYGMTVTLSSGSKQLIAKDLKISNIRSINNALTDLVKAKILTRIATGVYQFNPYLFGKGDWQDIARMRLEIDYDEIKGRTYQSVLSYKGATDPAVEPEPQPPKTIEDKIEQVTGQQPMICKDCGAILIERTNSRTNEKFLGCPNWRNHHEKTKTA